MKNSTGGLENKDEEISQKVEQNEKHGKYEKKDREPVQEAQHSERMNRENKRGNHQQNNSRKVPRTKVVRLKGVTKCPKQWIKYTSWKASMGNSLTLVKKKRFNTFLERKKQVTYKGSGIRMAWDFSTATLEPKRQWSNIFKILKDNYLQRRVLYKE